ncbi:MAG: helix-turn-helix domain-containing protein [Gemmatimonadaceae bacterium]
MRFGTRLSDPLLLTFRAVFGGDRNALLPIPAWSALDEILDRQALDIIVLDPALVGPQELPNVVATLAMHADTPVVVYTALSPAGMRGTVELTRAGMHHVVLKGFDDGPKRFRAFVEKVAGGIWNSALFDAFVRARIAHLSRPLALAVELLFRQPRDFFTVHDLARAAGMHRRSVERALGQAGIASARRLVVSALVERGHHYLRHDGCDIDEAARRLRYPNARLFARHARWATGHSPSVLRRALSTDELVACLARRLTATRHADVHARRSA